MRLVNTSSFELVEFTEDEIPYGQYAVLSHRWTHDEVTFKEFRKGLKPQSIGYQKVVEACKYAKGRKRPYIWVDTCCIDKRSSAELSEAVNSMFRWYQRSAECYVYLQDVVLPESHDDPVSLENLLQDCQWFKRGWTLQELLAPAEVIFLTAQWTSLGTRQDDEMATVVSQITSIGLYDLNNFNQQRPSVARKMSWASRRTTTRPEDIAYCLLGLFDVSMPLLYGEGAGRAFMRLQQEVIRKSDDKSIFAWGQGTELGLVWYGLLAPSPAPFEHYGDIVVDDGNFENKYPYEMTNQGLSLRSQAEMLLGEGSEKFLIDLDCMKLASNRDGHLRRYRCYLILEPITPDGRMYRRRHFAFGGLGEDVELKYPKEKRGPKVVKHFYVKQSGL
ncbi:putative heterokaryon incompatibility [Septoria linicola]|nr:putative heterokaryon incompatibility [Septoria linicola]